MILNVDHVTRYSYGAAVRGVVQSHRLQPSLFDGQRVVHWSVTVSNGRPGGMFRDGAGDLVQGWTVRGPVRAIEVAVRGCVDTTDLAGMLRGHRERTPPQSYLRDTRRTRADAALTAMAAAAATDGDGLDFAHRLAARVADAIAYVAGATDAGTTAAEALALGSGVCQDHAHAMIAAARSRGIPARYVSGYLHASADGALHEAAHAWAEVWLEGTGWVGFDPANRCCPDARYIRLGSGYDAQDAAPIRGTARGRGTERLEVVVAVQSVQQ